MRSLLESNESSVVLHVTSASSSAIPSVDLLVAVTLEGSLSAAPVASALLSLSDVPANTDPSPTNFPVYSIAATFDAPVDTAVHWEVLDARTCNATGADSDPTNLCTGGALLWNVTTLPGDSKTINATLLHTNFTAHINASTDVSGGPLLLRQTAGLHGALAIIDQTGAKVSTKLRGEPLMESVWASILRTRLCHVWTDQGCLSIGQHL